MKLTEAEIHVFCMTTSFIGMSVALAFWTARLLM